MSEENAENYYWDEALSKGLFAVQLHATRKQILLKAFRFG